MIQTISEEKGKLVLNIEITRQYQYQSFLLKIIVFLGFGTIGVLGLLFIFAVMVGLSFGAMTMPIVPFLLLPIALVYALFHYRITRHYVLFENGIEFNNTFYYWSDFTVIRESRFNFLHKKYKRFVTFLKVNNVLGDLVANEVIFIIPIEQTHIFSKLVQDRFKPLTWTKKNQNALVRSLVYICFFIIFFIVYQSTGTVYIPNVFLFALLLFVGHMLVSLFKKAKSSNMVSQ